MAKRSQVTRPEPKPKRTPKGSGLVISGVPRVNLLPPSEVQRRAAGTLMRRWVAALMATAVVVSGLVAAAYWGRTVAELQLASEQTRTMELNGELAGLSHVSQALAERTALTNLRAEAMGTDIEWRPLLTELTRSLPTGSELIGFELISGTNPVAEAEEPGAGIGVIGRLTVRTQNPADHKRMVDTLRSLDVTLTADAGALTAEDEKRFTFVVEFVLDQTHYSRDHLPEKGVR